MNSSRIRHTFDISYSSADFPRNRDPLYYRTKQQKTDRKYSLSEQYHS